MDPWTSKEVVDVEGDQVPKFDDNFTPLKTPVPFEKLPDSEEYLASLEKRLEKVRKAGGTKAALLQSLEQTKNSCMLKLLSDSGVDNLETFFEEEVGANLLLKKLAPEKVAISAQELIHLLQADQLELNQEQLEQTEQETKEDN